MVDPHGERTTLEDSERPSESVASSHKSRAGDKKGLGVRRGEMGDGKQRKQRLARRLPLSHCKHCNSNSSSSSSSDGAPAVIHRTEFAERATLLRSCLHFDAVCDHDFHEMRTPIRSDDHDVERAAAIVKYVLCGEICQSSVCDKTRVEIDVLTVVAKDAMSAMVELTTETGTVVLMNEALNKHGIS